MPISWPMTWRSCATLLIAGGLMACQPSPDQLWRDAQLSQASGKYTEAVIQLKNLLQREPGRREAREALGEVALALGDGITAETELRRAVTLGVPAAKLVPLIAQALLIQGRNRDALAELAKLPAGQPPDPRVLLIAGRAHEGVREWAEAEGRYREAIAAAPGDAAGYVATAGILMSTGRDAEADPLIAQALLRDPVNVQALLLQGRRLLVTANPADAEALFNEARSAAREPRLRALALMHIVEVELLQARLDDAQMALRQLDVEAPAALLTRYLHARWAAQKGDYDGAIRALQEITRDQPGFEPGLRLLGTVHYLRGNLEQAGMYLSKLVPPEGGDPYLRQLLAEIRVQQERPEQALQTLLPMMRAGPAAVFDQGLLILAGQASLRLGNRQSALAFFRRGAEAFPQDERFQLGEVSARLASGDLAGARGLLEKLGVTAKNHFAVDYLTVVTNLLDGKRVPARDLAQQLVGSSKGAGWARLLYATVLLVNGDARQGRTELEAVVSAEPASKEALLSLARLDVQEGKTAAATDRLKAIIRRDPADYRPRVQLAEIELAGGDFAAAESAADAASQIAPDVPAVLNLLGRAAAAAGHWDKAQESFARITALDPRNARDWLNLARAMAAAGQSGNAAEALHKALDLSPADAHALATAGDLLLGSKQPVRAAESYARAYAAQPSARVAVLACRARLAAAPGDACPAISDWLGRHPDDAAVRIFRAGLLAGRGQTPVAVADYEAALQVQPDNATALNNLAWLYFLKKDARALVTVDRALALEPGSAAFLDTAGWIRVRTGAQQQGITQLRAAAANATRNPDIQYHLAWAEAQGGDRSRARTILGEILGRDSAFASRREAAELLHALESPGRELPN